jgi:hypothetical protein
MNHCIPLKTRPITAPSIRVETDPGARKLAFQPMAHPRVIPIIFMNSQHINIPHPGGSRGFSSVSVIITFPFVRG